MEHRLGIRSKVVVGATYGHSDGRKLSKSNVMRAVKDVLEKQPTMRTVAVMVPPEDPEKGAHKLMMAVLHDIDLEQCVQFEDGEGISEEMVEKFHNEWDWTDPDRPWFKVVVVGNTVYYVNHHSVNDGTSGYIFHHDFAAALNNLGESFEEPSSWIVPRDASKANLSPNLHAVLRQAESMGKPWKVNLWEALRPILFAWTMHLILAAWVVFADIPGAPKGYSKPTVTSVAHESERAKTKTVLRQIPKSTMDKLVPACRENGTTVTALLMTMLTATITNDYQPNKSLLMCCITSDIRRRLPEELQEVENVTMGNRAGGVFNFQRTGKFKKTLRQQPVVDKLGEKSTLVNDEIWELARDAKKWMHDGLEPASRTCLATSAQPNELEVVVDKSIPMSHCMKPAFNLGNLGPFVPKTVEKGWEVKDVVFSGPPQGGVGGGRAPLFQVGGVRGGNSHIATNYQDGDMPRSMIEGMVDKTLARIEELVR